MSKPLPLWPAFALIALVVAATLLWPRPMRPLVGRKASGVITCAAFMPDGEHYVVGMPDGVEAWPVEGVPAQPPIPGTWTALAAIDRVRVAAVGDQGRLAILSLEPGVAPVMLQPTKDDISSVDCGGGWIVMGTRHAVLKVPVPGGEPQILATTDRMVTAVALRPNGLDVAWGDDAGQVHRTSAADPVGATEAGPVIGVAWTPNGVVAAQGDSLIWPDGHRQAMGMGLLTRLCASPSPGLLAVAGDRTVKVLAADGRELASVPEAASDIRALALSPDGRRLLTASIIKKTGQVYSAIHVWPLSR